MKVRHVASERLNARATLEMIGAKVGQDFFTLRTSQVEALLKEADQHRYRRPPNANGSRARYFYEMIQRRAR